MQGSVLSRGNPEVTRRSEVALSCARNRGAFTHESAASKCAGTSGFDGATDAPDGYEAVGHDGPACNKIPAGTRTTSVQPGCRAFGVGATWIFHCNRPEGSGHERTDWKANRPTAGLPGTATARPGTVAGTGVQPC